MRPMSVVQIAFLIAIFSGCATLKERFALSYDTPAVAAFWVERNPPTEPLNAAEALAVQAAAGLMTLQRVKGSAYYEGQEEAFTIIRHEQRTSDGEAYLISVKYRIRDGLVQGESIPHVVAVIDPKKEGIARAVAFSVANGISSIVPEIYEGRVFVPKKDSLNGAYCIIDVVEKDLDREYATYRIKTC